MRRKLQNQESQHRQWAPRSGRLRPNQQDVVRSFSAPHPTKVIQSRHKSLPARSMSATETPAPKTKTLDELYDVAYCDATSPSEDDSDDGRKKRQEVHEPPKAEIPVGPPKRVIASLVAGSALQRAQLRPPVRSYNPRIRDLARDTRDMHPRWSDDDFISGNDSVDLVDVDEVGASLQAAERQLHLGANSPGGAALELGALTSPAAVMLAIQESDDDEDDDNQVTNFPQDLSSSFMGNLKTNTLGSRQNCSQLSSTQTTLSQAQVTSSMTQMVSNTSASSSRMASHLNAKASSMKSDLSELQSSMSELKKTLRLRNSMENLVDAADPECDTEPLVTFPDSETPPPVVGSADLSMAMPMSSLPSSSNNSAQMLASLNSSSMDTMKFQQKRTTTASSKVITEGFSSSSSTTEEQQRRDAARQHRSAFKQLHLEGEVKQQEASLKMQSSDSYTSEQKASIAQQQARQHTVVSGNSYSSKEHMTITTKGMSTKSSSIHTSGGQISTSMTNGIMKMVEDDISSVNFEDLDSLNADSSSKDVERAIHKYSSRLDAFIKTLKQPQTTEIALQKAFSDLNKINEIIRRAWAVPTYGHELGYSLCNTLRVSGGLDLLMTNCDDQNNKELQFASAQLLEQCLTTENRAHVVDNGLEKVVKVACVCTKNANSVDHSRVGTGILEHLFKHSEGTCSDVIRLGGLDAVLFECRKNDVETLRHCAGALANLSLYGGAENQEAMIKRKVPMWLFPLAFHNDDNIKYYACLAIAVLVANTEIEAAVLKSGTLNLVEPFVTSHNPSEFARSNHAHAHGQSKNWLQKLVPVLSSKREEARNLAAFHFCMEAGIKKMQGNTEIFRLIGAIEPLKKVASCPNAVASKYAAQALRLIGEDIPHKLSQQVPLWSAEDVREWVKQIGFTEYAKNFMESKVDGDLLLQITEENLKNDIGLQNGIKRQRFTRELQNLKKIADYSSKDADSLNAFLQKIGPEYSIYTYAMLNAGVDKNSFRSLNDEQLENECAITNSIHRSRILNSIKTFENTLSSMSEESLDKSLDVFVSYRRSNGSQLASLLKVHLQLRGFTVFIDVERLEAGKFDNNLLQSIRRSKHFLLVLTPQALDRCIADGECKDWVHREIVAALQSQCNIIPIIDNFSWPEADKLPEDMRQVCHFNGVRWIHDYQDACVEKLERFMRGESSIRGEPSIPRSGLGGKDGSNTPSTPAALARGPPTYQRMHSSDSNKGSDKDQSNGTHD